VAAGLCAGLLLAVSIPASAGVDAKLLDMLKANGSINAAQHAELQADLSKEQQAEAAQKSASSKFEEKLAWAAKTQFKGDIRLRYENTSVDHDTTAGNPNGTHDKDRQRVRMRLGAYTQINPEVDTGIRIATGSNDRRSTNQDLSGSFTKKDIWLDQAYIDWHPDAIKGLHLIGGKMPQPWVSMGDVIWDSDINPEGVATTYSHALGASAELFGSAGYYNLEDNIDGEGYEFGHDLQMYTGQLGVRLAPMDKVAVTLGASVYSFDNENTAKGMSALAVNGNTTSEFQLWEGFAQVDLANLPLPLSVYGQYVVNDDSSDDADTAWLLGFKTGYKSLKFDYNYRDVERNAVVGAFTDSDFASGVTGSRGHKFKLGYDISKNFAVGATYLMAETDTLIAGFDNNDANTFQLDLEAKF
jgi:hypothetical protein